MAWLLKNWRWLVMAAATALVIGLWAYASHLRHAGKAQKAQTQAAVQQAKVQTAVTKAVDAVAVTTTKVEERTRVVVKTIHEAPGADTPLPTAVRDAWLAGLRDDDEAPPH